tara:strand:+ start:16048 stop:18084 length:2037 start_codon:yes stop_codon:yes gene_type:complete
MGIDYLGNPRGENKQFFPDKNIGPTYEEAIKFLTKERSDGLSFNESDAHALVISLGVGPVLKLSELVQRGARGTAQAFRDMGSFIQDPSGATLNGIQSLINTAVKGWNYANPFNSIDAKVDADGNYFSKKKDATSPAPDNADELANEQAVRDNQGFLPKDQKGIGGLKGVANFLIPGTRFDPFKGGSSESSQTPKGIGDLLTSIGLDGNQTVLNKDGSTATRAEVEAAIAQGQERGKLTKLGEAAGEELLKRFDEDGDGKIEGEERKAYEKAKDLELGPNSRPGTGGLYPGMGGRRQEYGGGNYSPASGFDNMANYYWPMALNDAAMRGEDVSSPEGIEAIFNETFPGGDYNRFKYSGGPGALAFFGEDSIGPDGRPLKSTPDATITNAEGEIIDDVNWYTYDPITGEALFTEAGYNNFRAANPGVVPPVGVRRGKGTSAGRGSEPDRPSGGVGEDGERNLPPIPKPDRNGACPTGYYGADTNGDGFNDVCIPYQSDIPGAPDNEGLGMAGRERDPNASLEESAEASAKQVFNDPTNFMRFAPSALQMIDPRYYNITSFVPRGEEKDFNIGYQNIPGQQYANYPTAKAAQGGLMSLADGGTASYPRVNGQIAGPGTEKSDDIPAMLSDGEFVVNAAAVRGIGNLMGKKKPKSKMDQRREGARTMYALQKAGEKAAGIG